MSIFPNYDTETPGSPLPEPAAPTTQLLHHDRVRWVGVLAALLLAVSAGTAAGLALRQATHPKPVPVRTVTHQEVLDAQFVNLVRAAAPDRLPAYSDAMLVAFARHACTAYRAGHDRAWTHAQIRQDLPHAADASTRVSFYGATTAAVLIECPQYLARDAS